jgi:hypothetical protein
MEAIFGRKKRVSRGQAVGRRGVSSSGETVSKLLRAGKMFAQMAPFGGKIASPQFAAGPKRSRWG